MNFIKLNEQWYHNGGYMSKPLICNIEEISNIVDDDDRYTSGSKIFMRNGKAFTVQESIKEVLKKIDVALSEVDDLK